VSRPSLQTCVFFATLVGTIIPQLESVAADIAVGDAYVRSEANDTRWVIGSAGIEQTFDCSNGQFLLTSYKNKLTKPTTEYIVPEDSCASFGLDMESFTNNQPIPKDFSSWKLENAKANQIGSGGRPAVQLDFVLIRANILARFHILAFPGVPILRQWVELENSSPSAVVLTSPVSACWRLRGDIAASYTNCWMIGGNAIPDQGKIYQKPITSPYSLKLDGKGTGNFVPWMAIHRTQGPQDGLFVALEYLGNWSLAVDHKAKGPLVTTAAIPELKMHLLKPGERLALPVVTFGVFCDGLDNMAANLYDWQYEYLWDYTNPDYYARIRSANMWFWCSQNLQEQFTARLANLDMTADVYRMLGYEMLWDDAGWSSFPGPDMPPNNYGSVFKQTYEGPDFAQTQRYLQKSGMRWLLWFSGRPSAGVLDSKIGAWGDFEWRTDAVDFPNMTADHGFREEVKRFLDVHPQASFHTCSGGSTYAHTFEIGGRYASFNYLSDCGRGPFLNYYFSYLEPPDKWGDILELLLSQNRYETKTARSMLTAVPSPYGTLSTAEDRELMRRNMELYRFLRRQGLAGRWSYVAHPAVEGDAEHFYFQRMSHDRLKACIIPTHQAKSKVVIRPRCLVAEQIYVVGLDSVRDTQKRTGADLMNNGIVLEQPKPGEMVYLNLPNRPGSGSDRISPQQPGHVLTCRETNIGHSGIGIYWSPGADNNWISYYEVSRDGKAVDKISLGTYYFDHASGWDSPHQYAVRTVDGDGNVSSWTTAQSLPDEPTTYASLGGHFGQSGRDGWSEETTADNRVFTPMTWVPPARNPAADFGGTPNQRGGVEGYWEGPGGSRVGRGWQQASKTEGCVRTWTAPKAGIVQISGRAMREYYHRDKGGPLKVAILHGQQQIWPEKDWAPVAQGDLTGVTHNIKLNVAAGDVIRFVLDKGTIPEHDLIAWMPQIVYSEPKSAADRGAVVRVLCGAKTPYTDRSGNLWTADQFFTGGEPVSTTARIEETLPTLEDQPLYQNGRAGKDFSYSIPVHIGIYTIRLKFAEPKHPWMFARPINLDMNGQQVLMDFDIVQAAKHSKKAVERTFRNVVPNAEGKIVLHFTSGKNHIGQAEDAMVQAIEVLPERKPVVRINAGSDSEFVDWNGRVWAADMYSTGGTALKSTAPVLHASPTLHDQELYHTARSGKSVVYAISMPPGLYSVHLKFAELWQSRPGERPMAIAVNGRLVQKSWDPATTAGRIGMATDLRIDNITPDKEGRIIIDLHATGMSDAIIQGIEIE